MHKYPPNEYSQVFIPRTKWTGARIEMTSLRQESDGLAPSQCHKFFEWVDNTIFLIIIKYNYLSSNMVCEINLQYHISDRGNYNK